MYETKVHPQFKLLSGKKKTEVAIRQCKYGSDTHMNSCSKRIPFNTNNVRENPNFKKIKLNVTTKAATVTRCCK